MKTWSRKQSDELNRFCKEHHEAFTDWCKRSAASFYTPRRIGIGLTLLSAVSVWNFIKISDNRVLLAYLPALVLLYGALSPVVKLSPFFRLISEFVSASTVVGVAYLLKIGTEHKLSASNAPVQIVLMLAVGMSFYPTARLTLLRTIVYGIFASCLVYFWSAVPLGELGIQLVVGPVAGYLLASAILEQQKSYFYNTVTNASMTKHSYNELVKLVPNHVVLKIQTGEALEKTMPTMEGMGCVLCFDVVKSSQIDHPDFLAVVGEVKNQCYRLLKDGYTNDGLRSTGFRIKDTGDGFLCSVGYPYQTPADQSPSMVSHELALRCCEIFDHEMSKLRLPTRPRCSIGIAYGEIIGFFPTEEPMQYDLRGRVIMLATRYEAMRNKLIDESGEGRGGNIIFIQERVWLGLSNDMRTKYELWECDGPGKKIRDDNNARRAYYLFTEEKEFALLKASA